MRGKSKFFIFFLLLASVALFGFRCTRKAKPASKAQKLATEAESFLNYSNTRYGFSLEYPPKWFRFGEPESDIVHFSTVNKDPPMGGPPLGARVEIMVLENIKGLSLEEWLNWMNSEGPEKEIENEEEITVGGKKAIKEVVASLPGPVEAGSTINVYLAKGQYIIQINYLGREPDYSENLENFDHLLESFVFN